MAEGNAGSIKAGRAFVEIGADSRELEAKVKKGQSLLQQLKQGLGEESAFGGIGKALAGAGAVAGLALGARLLNDMATNAVKWKDAMASGAMSSGDVAEELLRSLPVLGQIREAGLAIRELFTGEEAATQSMLREVAATNTFLDKRLALQKAITQAAEDQVEVMRKLKQEGAIIGASPEQRAKLEAQFRSGDEARARTAGVAAAKAAVQKTEADQAAGINKEITRLEKEKAAAEEAAEQAAKGGFASVGASQGGPDPGASARESVANLEAQRQTQFGRLKITRDEAAAALAAIDAQAQANEREAAENHYRKMNELAKEAADAEVDAVEALNEEVARRRREREDQEEKARLEQIELFENRGAAMHGWRPDPEQDDPEKMVDEIQQSVERALGSSTIGTFSPFVAERMGGGGELGDIAKSSRETAREIRDLNRKARGGGLTFK